MTSPSDQNRPSSRWHPHPTYHLKAPRGWINDPCAPGYDPTTGLYHLFYQWNPQSCDWGNITWGHFTSTDGLHWTSNGDGPVLVPDQPYDHQGIFTGCFWPTGVRGQKNQLTVLYSSITSLPIHWTIPYARNCAGLAVATSSDNGVTWQKAGANNPILDGEPENLEVLGFRDPYLSQWLAMDKLRGQESLYGIMSGGLPDRGPAVFLYSVAADSLDRWNYTGPLVDIPSDSSRPGHWEVDLGRNWECVNFMTLRDGESEVQFLTFGAEGCFGPGADDRNGVRTLWMAGSLEQTADGPRMKHGFSGIFDHGCLYAPNTYEHPITKQRIAWGWLKEDELTLARREAKGWTGYLSIPREVFLCTVRHVVGALKTPLEEIGAIQIVEGNPNANNTVQTLGIRPLPELKQLRQANPRVWLNLSGLALKGTRIHVCTTSWELEAEISLPSDCQRVGFSISHNESASERTTILFSPQEENITVNRSQSNQESDVKKDPISGPFTLFYLEEEGSGKMENLHLRIFRDGDVLEVFANSRFALSTMVYTGSQDSTSINWYLQGQDVAPGVFRTVKLWEGIQ